MVVTRAQSKAAEPAQNDSSSNDDEDTPPLNAFTCFPRLPFELRVLIWKVICFEPRDVDIGIRERGRMYSGFTHPTNSLVKELRVEALKWYKLEFGFEVVDRGFTITMPPKIYVNFEVDRLCWMDWGNLAEWNLRLDGRWGIPQESYILQRCKNRNLRRLAFNPGTMARVMTTALELLVSEVTFLDEIAFLFEPDYLEPPWKGDVFKLEDWRRVVDSGPGLAEIRAFKKMWMDNCTASNHERTPTVKYLALMKNPGVEYTFGEGRSDSEE